MSVRTRFAPSPTGYLHIGSARTALFAWLYARKHHGQFILRIEDTDQERSTQQSIDAILDGMQWLGLDYDEGPFYQTQRLARYDAIAAQLLESGHAYRCVCSKERLQELREQQLAQKQKPRYDGHCRNQQHTAASAAHGVIRFRQPDSGTVSFDDHVYGTICVHNSELDDLILIRSDGMPTYNFAVIVDDNDMQITHVIRGDDHINNTPRQINLLHALGWAIPTYAHAPMILGADGARLSKRHGAVSVLEYREQGYLPHALLNYLLRLGWSHGDQEIFSPAERIALFDTAHINRAAASVNAEKLLWLNQQYLKQGPAESIAPKLAYHLQQDGVEIPIDDKLTAIVAMQAERCKTLVEMAQKSVYFYQTPHTYDANAAACLVPAIAPALQHAHDALQALTTWQAPALHACIVDTATQQELKLGKLAQPLRAAVTGTTVSPPLDLTLETLGQAETLTRLQHALNYIARR